MKRRGILATATPILAVFLAMVALNSCKVQPRRSAMRQILLEQELQQVQRAEEDGRARVYRLEQEVVAKRQEIERKDLELRQVRAQHEVRVRELDQQLTQLHRMEEDLAAAKTRRAAAESELASVKALEDKVKAKDKIAMELQARLQDVEAQLVARRKQVDERQADLQATLALLQQREKVLGDLTQQVRAALQTSPQSGTVSRENKVLKDDVRKDDAGKLPAGK